MKNSPIYLAFLGPSCGFKKFLEAIKNVEGVLVIGWWSREGKHSNPDNSISFFENPIELIDRKEVAGVVNCTSLTERAFWNKQAVIAGKPVLCESPLGKSYEDIRGIFDCREDRTPPILPASHVFHGKVALAIMEKEDFVCPLLFFELNIQMSSQKLAGENQGVILLKAIDYLSLIHAFWGSIDSIWAQSRSLIRNRASEDLATVYLKFKDGKEGIISINGLGKKDQVELKLFGRSASQDLFQFDNQEEGEVWEFCCREFIDYIHKEKRPSLFNRQLFLGGFGLMDWICQAARFNREITQKEVIK